MARADKSAAINAAIAAIKAGEFAETFCRSRIAVRIMYPCDNILTISRKAEARN
jgi:hypothetical protein